MASRNCHTIRGNMGYANSVVGWIVLIICSILSFFGKVLPGVQIIP